MAEIRERWGSLRAAPRLGRRRLGVGLAVAATAGWLGIGTDALFAEVRSTYLYSLSSLAGQLPYDGVRVRVDAERDETYVIYQNVIRIFNPSGMEVFSFGDGLEVGQILDAAIDRNGDILLLSFKDSKPLVTRCNYRGVPVGPLAITNLPDGLVFVANRMLHRNGLLYFVSLATSSVTITDASGTFRKHIDFLPMLEVEDRQKGEAETIGFTVDEEGNIFFTMPAIFKVYRYSPDGRLTYFGKAGSAPGRFGIVAGIVSDRQGNLFVADRLKCVVMVFDRDFNFLTEFGYRGSRPGNLIQPEDVAIDRQDRLYVSQWRRRGVSVFALTRD